jgi:hypothetical protein
MQAELTVFYLNDRRSLIHRWINLHTGGRFAHCAIGLCCPASSWERVAFETKAANDELLGKSGLRGPFPSADLYAWKNRQARTRQIVAHSLTVSQKEADTIYFWLLTRVPRIRYAGLQLLSLAINTMFKTVITRRQTDPHRWTCSETIARALPLYYRDVALHVGEYRFDEYMPSGTHGPGLYEMLQKDMPDPLNASPV